MVAVGMVLGSCTVTESSRSGGLIPPAGPVSTAAVTSPVPTELAPTLATVLPRDDLSSAISAVATDPPPSAAGHDAGSRSASAATDPPTSAADGLAATTQPPPSTELDSATTAREVLAAADPLPGFSEGVLGVTGAGGTEFWPVIIADTPQAHQRGLMGVTDFAALGGYAAMAFIFDGDTSGPFWMRDTPLPLRITFVAASGSVVSGTDMVPCLPPTPSDECALYRPDGPYRIAIEHPLGPAFDLGLSTAEFVEVTVEQ